MNGGLTRDAGAVGAGGADGGDRARLLVGARVDLIVSPTANPATLATFRFDGFGVAGSWMFEFHGAMP